MATDVTVQTLWNLKRRSQDLLVAGEMLKEHSTLDRDAPEDYQHIWDQAADAVHQVLAFIDMAAERTRERADTKQTD
jgi:hypothetical protein